MKTKAPNSKPIPSFIGEGRLYPPNKGHFFHKGKYLRPEHRAKEYRILIEWCERALSFMSEQSNGGSK